MTPAKIIGLDLRGESPKGSLASIMEADKMGIPAVWMTSSGGSSDTLSLFAAAALNTKNILFGTSYSNSELFHSFESSTLDNHTKIKRHNWIKFPIIIK